jgi:DNA polymerase delta subunit 3
MANHSRMQHILQTLMSLWLYRILQEFAEQSKGDNIEVVYVVAGWTKNEPRNYSVQLVTQDRLQEARETLHGSPSSHVYSVQPCLPKDPAQLFAAEFVQAQELFKQPSDVDNCLRDNRYLTFFYQTCCTHLEVFIGE